MKLREAIFLNDLAQLYGRLNHGDDDELLSILKRYGYTVKYNKGMGYGVVPYSPQNEENEDE